MERINPPENFITRLNYSETAKGTLALSVLFPLALMAQQFDQKPLVYQMPHVLKNKMYDSFNGLCTGPFFRILENYIPRNDSIEINAGRMKITKPDGQAIEFNVAAFEAVLGFVVGSVWEVGQFGVPGFQWEDFGAYGISSVLWYALDKTAKDLYDDKLMLPFTKTKLSTRGIYKTLGIQDRRLKNDESSL